MTTQSKVCALVLSAFISCTAVCWTIKEPPLLLSATFEKKMVPLIGGQIARPQVEPSPDAVARRGTLQTLQQELDDRKCYEVRTKGRRHSQVS